jgi:hypothetical protein
VQNALEFQPNPADNSSYPINLVEASEPAMTLDLRRILLLVIDNLALRRYRRDAIPDLGRLTLSAQALRDLNLPPEIAMRIEAGRPDDGIRRRPYA